jgi:predicted acyltransferase
MTLHAFWRAFVLIALGVFLRSIGRPRTNFTFEDTLSQIGLGYGFLFLLGFQSIRTRWIAFAVILAGYWGAFALYSPGSDFAFERVGVPSDWPYLASGFGAHWNKNANLAWAFDSHFLNLFPRDKTFTHNGGGYATLSFIPTLATMILGLIAGDVLRSADHTSTGKLRWLVVAGVIALIGGFGICELGVCPVVKRIWTPTWVLYSGGWCFLLLAAFYAVIDLAGLRTWAFPLVVIGMNSIAAYCLSHLIEGFIVSSLKTHLGREVFKTYGSSYESLLQGGAVLLVLWLILYWMYRRKLFLRI